MRGVDHQRVDDGVGAGLKLRRDGEGAPLDGVGADVLTRDPVGVDRLQPRISGEEIVPVGGVDDRLQVGGPRVGRPAVGVELQCVVPVDRDVGHDVVGHILEGRPRAARVGEAVVAREIRVAVLEGGGDFRLPEVVLIGQPQPVTPVVVAVVGRLPGVALHGVVLVVVAVLGAQPRAAAQVAGVADRPVQRVARLRALRVGQRARGVVRRVAEPILRIAEGVLPRVALLPVGAPGAADAEGEDVAALARQAEPVEQVAREVAAPVVTAGEVAAPVEELPLALRQRTLRQSDHLAAEVVVLRAERGPEHQRVDGREFVVEAGVEAVVPIEDPRVGPVVVELHPVARREALPLARGTVPVAGAVEEVAGRDFALAAPGVAVVDADGLHGREAVERLDHEVLVRAANVRLLRGPQQILEGEVLAAQVVGQSYDGEAPLVVEEVDVSAADVFVPEAVAAEELAEGAVPLVRPGDDVEGHWAVARVDAGHFRHVAAGAEDVDTLDDVGGDVADGRQVVAEELPSVHVDPLDGAPLRLDPLLRDLQAGHLRQQRLGVRSEGHAVGVGPVGEGVAPHRTAQRLRLDPDLGDLLGPGAERQRVEHQPSERRQLHPQRVVAQRVDAQPAGLAGQPQKGATPLRIGEFVARPKRGAVRTQLRHGADDRLPRGGIGHSQPQLARLSGGCEGAGQQGSCEPYPFRELHRSGAFLQR